MRKNYILIFIAFLLFPMFLSSQNGLIGDGFGANNWSTIDGFSGSAGSSRIGTFNANSTGNRYFRLVTNWDGNNNQWGPLSTTEDYEVTIENEVPGSEIIENSTTKAYYINSPNISYNYVFKTKEGGNPPGNKGLIAFEVQGAVRAISSVSQSPSNVFPGQEVTVTATMDGTLNTGQGVYLRYSTDGWGSSTISEMSLAHANDYSTTIQPSINTPSASISYYVFSSGDGLTIDHADADWYTINLDNNSGSNYSYNVLTGWATATDGNWATQGTWTANAVPSTTEGMGDVTIGHDVTLDQNAKVSSITINPTKTLTPENSENRILTLNNNGAFTNNGSFTAKDGTVVFLGDGTISGTLTFYDVTINGGVDFGTGATVAGVLSIEAGSWVNTNCPAYGALSTLKYNTRGNYQISAEWDNVPQNVTVSNSGTDVHIDDDNKTMSGNLLVDNDASLTIDATKDLTVTGTVTVNAARDDKAAGSFTIKSDAVGTGSLITNGTVSGSITVERFLSGGWDWHFLASPVANQKFLGAENFIEFTFGAGGNEGDPNIDIYRWGETEATTERWINIRASDKTLNTSFGTPSLDPEFDEGMGYLVAYDKGATIIKSFTGEPNTGDYTATLTYTSSGGTGWNLVGNQYPSAIDWESASLVKTNLESGYYYVYNENKTGGAGYEYYLDASNKTDGVNGKIPAMQGFFVEAASGGGSLGIGNAARTHNDQAFLKSTTEYGENLLKLSLSDQTNFSTAQFRLREDGNEGEDYYDASMLFSLDESVPQLYSITPNGKKLALNSLPMPEDEIIIPLGMKLANAGSFTVNTESIETFTSEYAPFLEDTQAGQTIDLRQNNSYSFAANEAGYLETRFLLHLKSTVGVDEIVDQVIPSVYVNNNRLHLLNSNGLDWQISVTDITGRVLHCGVINDGGVVDLPVNIKTGVYIVRIANGQSSYNQKVFVR